MVFLKLNELNGGPVIINMAQVEMITPITGSRTKLWLSVDGEDYMEVAESFEDVESMLHAALLGKSGVLSKDDVLAVVR